MTKNELKLLEPHKTMIYSKSDGVGYTFIGIDEQGLYKLCGMPWSYEGYIIMNSFELCRNTNDIKR